MKRFDEMDEFELAWFDEETCEQLRKICADSGLAPDSLICATRGFLSETDGLSEHTQLGIAWEVCKLTLWDEFEKSKIGKSIIRIADKLGALIERFKV